MPAYVTLSSEPTEAGPLSTLAVESSASNVAEALDLARRLGRLAPTPGTGSTRDLWESLATLASGDLGVARAIEPHLDAIAILRQAQSDDTTGETENASWGVFAAEGGEDPLVATRIDDHWSLTGTKPWCSLADRLERALVTARISDDGRGLFAVDLRGKGVAVVPGQWHARGLSEIPSGPITFFDTVAVQVGDPGWYLTRAGFAWGGIGVAACWYGGAVGIARSLFERAGDSPEPLMAAHLGAVDEQLQSARRALAEAAALVDRYPDASDSSVLAKRVRATVARASEAVLVHAAHALGPAPLALDEAYAKRVADLELYIRQHHAEKDDASLGTALAKRQASPW
jgi:alkylation response protein AidB-like acyl-CoA dehydrogenase